MSFAALAGIYGLLGRSKLTRGKDGALRKARDEMQLDIFQDTFWLAYCYYCGAGCMVPTEKACCLSVGECCCCAGTVKSATPCDGDGLAAQTVKLACWLTHCECPPSNTPGIGCGPFMCCGNLDRDPVELSPQEREELQLLQTTFWCLFLYCCGWGCNSPGGNDPCCKVEGKACCIWANSESTPLCEDADGWLESTNKCCCFVFDASFPAGITPGIGCCGFLVFNNVPRDGPIAPYLAQ
mmetsp:Transcript_4889/g.9961  ORF Transcript_4889/g.9961 Transcript_4889/m.9961 type:complete len:239 (+) Transcript_4889:42-758(+)